MNAKMKTVKTTVSQLIAAVLDVVGDSVDQAVEGIRFDDLRKKTNAQVDTQQRR